MKILDQYSKLNCQCISHADLEDIDIQILFLKQTTALIYVSIVTKSWTGIESEIPFLIETRYQHIHYFLVLKMIDLDCVQKMPADIENGEIAYVTDRPPVHTKTAHFLPTDFENGRF